MLPRIVGSGTCEPVRLLGQRRHGCFPGNPEGKRGCAASNRLAGKENRCSIGRSPVTRTEEAATSGLSGYRQPTTDGLRVETALQVKRGRKRRARSTVTKAGPNQKPVIILRTQKENAQAGCRYGSSPLKLRSACGEGGSRADSSRRDALMIAHQQRASARKRCVVPEKT